MNIEKHRARLRELQRTARTIADPEMARVYMTKSAEEEKTIAELEAVGSGVTADITKTVTPSTSRRSVAVPRTGVVADLAKAHVHYTESELLREAERLDHLEKLAEHRGDSDSARQWRAQSEEVQAKAVEMRRAAGFTTPIRKLIVGGKTTYLDMTGEADEIERSSSQFADVEMMKATRGRAAQIREDVVLEKSAVAVRTSDSSSRFALRRIEESDRCLAKAAEHEQTAEKMSDMRDRSAYRQLAEEQRELARRLRREATEEEGAQ